MLYEVVQHFGIVGDAFWYDLTPETRSVTSRGWETVLQGHQHASHGYPCVERQKLPSMARQTKCYPYL